MEVMISVLLITMVCVLSLRTYIMTGQMSRVESLRTMALYNCQESIEAMLSSDYEEIVEENYPPETSRVLDTRGTSDPEDDVYFDRTYEITDWSSGGRQQKDVRVLVSFNFAGKRYSESLSTRIVAAGR